MRAALALLLFAAPAAAQDYPPDGSELFRGVLHRYGYLPIPGSGISPRLVIVYRDPGNRAEWLAGQCQAVLSGGGSVLVAADRCDQLRRLLPGLPPVSLPGLSLDPGRIGAVGRAGPETVALIGPRPAGRAADLPVLPAGVATATPARRLDLPPRGPWADGVFAVYGRGQPFAAAVTAPGRAAVLAGESALSNRLLAATFTGRGDDADTGNLELAVNLARWLRPPGNGPTPCLFVEQGVVVRSFADVFDTAEPVPPLPTPAPPPLSAFLAPEAQAKLTDAVNETLDQVQENDRLNERLAGRRRFRRTMAWLVGVLALVATVTLVRRARAARRPGPPAAEPASPARAAGPFAQRREELLGGADHTAAVRGYLAELFGSRGLPLDEHRHPRRLPPVEADPPTRRQLATLWEAAYGPAPVTYSRWKELEPMVEQVRAAGQAGRWRFAGGRA
jgi:hypothetical protein